MQQMEVQSQMRGAYLSDGHEDNSVLIVNDLPEQLMLMDGLLRKAGYRVLTAEDGLEGFNLAKEERPDLVISDVCMPRVNGLEFCRLLRADNQLRSVPILLVSALETDTANVVAGLRAGADDYLEIPFDGTRLVAKVARLLERSRVEANYRDLVEQANDLIFTQDLAERLTSINAAGLKFLGRTAEEILGDSFSSIFGLVGVDFNSSLLANKADKPETLQEFRHQFIARGASGEERWLDLTISPLRNRLDEIVGFRGIARDITERKQAELALRDSEERYRLLFESTPQPICVYDAETLRFLTVNEAATRTYGYTRDEFLSMTMDDITQEDETGLSSPCRHQTKGKKTIYVEISSHPILFDDRNGELVIINDVTERRLLDERQQGMHASLQQSAIEWRQTFDAIDFPVLIVDLEGTIRRSNEAAEQIAGVQAEKLVGRSVLALGQGQPWKKAAELLERIREAGFPASAEASDETTGQTWVVTIFLINEFGSADDRAILIAQDITKRTELEASLRQSKMMSLLGSVVAGVAHEVRNPLFGISSILDAFETRFSDRTEYSRYTSVLRDEIGRLASLMEELLEYGRPFRGDVYPVLLEEMISRSIRACLPAAKAADITLVNNVPESLPRIMVDRRRLSTVFINLIENAIQHSPPGSVVTIDADKITDGTQDWIECSVKDFGPGIEAENLRKIFEPFFSTRRGGTGLGLAIAQKTIEEHGGKLLAGNNPEGGACMSARFPLLTEVTAGG
ncbi:MAG TPA: PAS domain S-box protein [Pyrinomonadaceae bacterium]|nr:PAS domain S-box protein [Pyrinomonadaceae bacterium]